MRFGRNRSLNTPKMADFQNVLIDGKLLSSLRVVDLKQELKKRGVKANGSKAQLQSLLFQVFIYFHLILF